MNEVVALHAAWCSAADQELSFRASERIFFELHKLEFTPDDVKLAVKHLLKMNAKFSGGHKFRINVIKVCGDTAEFSALVAEAKAVFRNARKAKTQSEKMLARYENAVEPEEADPRIKGNGRHLSDIIKSIAQ